MAVLLYNVIQLLVVVLTAPVTSLEIYFSPGPSVDCISSKLVVCVLYTFLCPLLRHKLVALAFRDASESPTPIVVLMAPIGPWCPSHWQILC